jgi:hypothetical protein
MQQASSIQTTKATYSMQAFQKREKLAAKQLFYQAKKFPLKEKIQSLQQVLILNPFSAKYQFAYAKLLKDSGDTDLYRQHTELAIGLQKAHRDALKLQLSGKSLYYAALIQYHTRMFHNWNAGFSLAAELLRNLPDHRSRIANSPMAAKPENAQLLSRHYAPKSNNARRQWPGANASLARRGAAAIITFFVLSFAGLHASASENSTKPEIVLQENLNRLLIDNQTVSDVNPRNVKQLHATTPLNKTPFGLDRIALILLILPLMALARAALPGKSKIIFSILLSSIFALGMNSAVNGQAASGWGRVNDTNGAEMNQARVTYIMAENEVQCLDTNTFSDGMYFFNNIDLITTVVDQTPTLEELTTYIGTGQDHNINIQTKERPSSATIYNMLGQPITLISPQWDGDVAHYYWDGSANGQELSVGSYIFTTAVNGEQFTQKVMQLNNGSFIGDNYQVSDDIFMNTKSTQTVEKKFYVHLNPDPEGDQFLPQVDTVWLSEGSGNEVYHYVEPIPATIDQYFKLVDSNTREGLENFTIRAKNETSEGEILAQALTNENGLALLENIPEDALLYLEYGPEFVNGADTSYYSSKGNKWQMLPDTWFANDTISPDTVKLALPNKNLIIPQTENDPAPATIWTPASYVSEMIKYNTSTTAEPINIEQACRNEIRIWINEEDFSSLQLENITNLLQDMDSLFYGTEHFPYTIVEDSINTENLEGMTYHHSENYHPGELGYNIRAGPDKVYTNVASYDEFDLNENNKDYTRNVLGGNIWINGSANAFFKEVMLRVNELDETLRLNSYTNDNPAHPNEHDRAITRIIRVNQHNRASVNDERVQSYSLHYLQNYFNE